MALSIKALFVTLSTDNTQHNHTSCYMCHYSVCRYAKFHETDCLGAKKCFILTKNVEPDETFKPISASQTKTLIFFQLKFQGQALKLLF
jgi:hypothetical protein